MLTNEENKVVKATLLTNSPANFSKLISDFEAIHGEDYYYIIECDLIYLTKNIKKIVKYKITATAINHG